MTKIPAIYLGLSLEKSAFAHLTAVMPDSSPQNTLAQFARRPSITDVRLRMAGGRRKTNQGKNCRQYLYVPSRDWGRKVV